MPFLVKNILRGSVAALFLATFVGCSNTHNGFTLSGRFADRASQKVTLLYCTFHATDTIGMATLSTDGSFSFEGNLAEPSICVMRIGTDDLLFLLDNVEMTLQSDTFTNHSTLQIDGYQRAEHFNKAVLLDKNRIKLYNSTEKELQQRITKGDTTMTVAAMHRQLAALDQLFRANPPARGYPDAGNRKITNYFIIPLKDKLSDIEEKNILGPLTKLEFDIKREELGIDKLAFNINFNHLE